MKHDFIDKYAELDTVIHRLDPRVKIVSFISFVFFVIFTSPSEFLNFLFYFILIFNVILISKVPLKFVFKRSLVIIPFVLFVAIFIPFFKQGEVAGSYSFGSLHLTLSYTGLIILWNVLVKSWLSVFGMLLLASTTKFPRLLKGFEKLKMPELMVMVLSFFYRYVFVLMDEAMRMKRARDSRSFGGCRVRQTRSIGNIIATLFVRAYERGERVYAAMVSRGFSGRIETLGESGVGRLDLCFLVLFMSCLVVIKLGILW